MFCRIVEFPKLSLCHVFWLICAGPDSADLKCLLLEYCHSRQRVHQMVIREIHEVQRGQVFEQY